MKQKKQLRLYLTDTIASASIKLIKICKIFSALLKISVLILTITNVLQINKVLCYS